MSSVRDLSPKLVSKDIWRSVCRLLWVSNSLVNSPSQIRSNISSVILWSVWSLLDNDLVIIWANLSNWDISIPIKVILVANNGLSVAQSTSNILPLKDKALLKLLCLKLSTNIVLREVHSLLILSDSNANTISLTSPSSPNSNLLHPVIVLIKIKVSEVFNWALEAKHFHSYLLDIRLVGQKLHKIDAFHEHWLFFVDVELILQELSFCLTVLNTLKKLRIAEGDLIDGEGHKLPHLLLREHIGVDMLQVHEL